MRERSELCGVELSGLSCRCAAVWDWKGGIGGVEEGARVSGEWEGQKGERGKLRRARGKERRELFKVHYIGARQSGAALQGALSGPREGG